MGSVIDDVSRMVRRWLAMAGVFHYEGWLLHLGMCVHWSVWIWFLIPLRVLSASAFVYHCFAENKKVHEYVM
jgi:hypothetical protein